MKYPKDFKEWFNRQELLVACFYGEAKAINLLYMISLWYEEVIVSDEDFSGSYPHLAQEFQIEIAKEDEKIQDLLQLFGCDKSLYGSHLKAWSLGDEILVQCLED